MSPATAARARARRPARARGELQMDPTLLQDIEASAEIVERRTGLSRREFGRFCAATATTLGLAAGSEAAIAQAVAKAKRPSVIWLHYQECTGCSESLLRAEHPTLDTLLTKDEWMAAAKNLMAPFELVAWVAEH